MPRVPRYDSPKVQSIGLPSVRVEAPNVEVPRGAFGGNDAKQALMFSDAAGQVADAMMKQKEQDDIDAVMAAKNDFRLFSADMDNQVGQRNGVNAKGASEWAGTQIEGKYAELTGGMNERQKKLFDQDVMPSIISARNRYVQHEQNETTKAHITGVESSIEIAAQQAVTNPDLVESNIAEINRSLDYIGQQQGWEQETIDQRKQKAATTIHSKIVAGLLAKEDLGGAQSYIKAHEGLIDPELQTRATKLIQEKAEEGGARAYAASVYATGIPFSEALERVNTEFGNSKEGDRRRHELTNIYAYNREIKEQQLAENTQKFNETYVAKGINAPELNALLEERRKIDPVSAVQMEQNLIDSRQRWANGENYARVTDRAAYDAISRDLDVNGENSKYRSEADIANARHGMTEADYKHLVTKIEGIQKVSESELFAIWKRYAGDVPDEIKTPNDLLSYSDQSYANDFRAAFAEWAQVNSLKPDRRNADGFMRDWFLTQYPLKAPRKATDSKLGRGVAYIRELAGDDQTRSEAAREWGDTKSLDRSTEKEKQRLTYGEAVDNQHALAVLKQRYGDAPFTLDDGLKYRIDNGKLVRVE